MSSTFKDFAIPVAASVVTLAIREGAPLLWRAYQKRWIDPHKAHRQIFLDQAEWYEDRAAKLAVFRVQISQEPVPDKFRLAGLVSKLDQKDSEWAMKHTDKTDIDLLRKWAADKGAECHDNAAECAGSADEIEYKIFQWL